MKKILTVTALISALLLTTGCAAANMAQDEQIAVMAAAGSDAAGEAAPITMDDAQAIALDHAGVSASKADNVKVEYDKEDGRYDVDFRYNNYEYDYEIHHTSGKVISHEKEYDAPAETKPASTKATEKPTEKSSSVIGKDKAKAIALDHAGVSASKATNVKVEYDKDDKKYDVEFRYGNCEYDYEIHHTSGKVISHDKEYEAPPEKATEKATEKPTEKASESSKIGKDKAKSIALKHAGLSSGDVRELQVEYDKDDGVPVYEVEFESGTREYSYEIHAETGKIRSHEIDD